MVLGSPGLAQPHFPQPRRPIESQSCQCRCMPPHTPDPPFELYKNPSVSPRFVPKSERSQIPFITASLHLPHILSQPIIINNHHANLRQDSDWYVSSLRFMTDSQGKQSPWKSNRVIPSTTSSPRSKTRRAFHQINSDLSLPGSSWKTAEHCRTIISRRKARFISSFGYAAECKSSSRPSPERPSLLKSSRAIPLTM